MCIYTTPFELILSEIPDFGKCRAAGAARPHRRRLRREKGVWGKEVAAAAASSEKSAKTDSRLA